MVRQVAYCNQTGGKQTALWVSVDKEEDTI